MASDSKVYVDVIADFKRDGTILPRSFIWEDGKRYEIDRVSDITPAASLKAGGIGLRYTVRVNNKDVSMYLEDCTPRMKWFMVRK